VAFNYLLCVRWVFPRSQTGSRKAQIGFLITSVMGLVLNTVLMWLLTVLFGEDAVLLTVMGFSLQVYLVNKAVATLLVMVWNYFTKRLVLKG
jgi:putative flippase GtrA